MDLGGIDGYTHRRINHSEKVYVVGDIHTNTIEGFWSLVKRGIGGVYHNVGRQYLQTYLNEYCFRYNHRFDTQPMFSTFMQQIEKRDAVVRTASIEATPFWNERFESEAMFTSFRQRSCDSLFLAHPRSLPL